MRRGVSTSDHVAHVVGGVAGEVHRLDLELAEGKHVVVIDQTIEDAFVLGLVDAIAAGEALLDGVDSLSDANGGLGVVRAGLLELLLEVPRGGEVVGVDVGLEDVPDSVPVLLDEGQEAVGRLGRDGAGGGVKVED